MYDYFRTSLKRIKIFKKFQSTILELKPHKLLHSRQTRWMSLLAAVDCLLEQFDALEAYFAVAALVDRLCYIKTSETSGTPVDKVEHKNPRSYVPLHEDMDVGGHAAVFLSSADHTAT